jgi:hypothetical protein
MVNQKFWVFWFWVSFGYPRIHPNATITKKLVTQYWKPLLNLSQSIWPTGKIRIKKNKFLNKDFTGQRCELQKDPCDSYPCQRGLCVSQPTYGLGQYRCQCPNGFTGVNCEADINECQTGLAMLCANNATCMNIMGSYYCQCAPG